MTLTVLEPRIYSLASPHSYFLDCAAVATPTSPGASAAQERLSQYVLEIGVEIGQNSAEGQRATRLIRESLRTSDVRQHERDFRDEIRATNTGTGSAGAFVTPQYLMDEWAPAYDVQPALANQTNRVPLAPYGMVVNVPTFQTGAVPAVQESAAGTGEGSAVSLDAPGATTGYKTANVETVATGITVSQQLIDRGRDSVGFDQALLAQLTLNVNAQVDSLVYQAILATGQVTAGAGPASAGALYSDVASARERALASGVRVRPTHLFTGDHVFNWLTKLSDSTGRPILQPQYATDAPPWGLTGDNEIDSQWMGFTGTVLPSGLLWFVDENVPGLLISRPASIVLAEGPPVFRIVTSSTAAGGAAGNLEAVATLYQYVAIVPVIPNANQVVTGWGAAS